MLADMLSDKYKSVINVLNVIGVHLLSSSQKVDHVGTKNASAFDNLNEHNSLLSKLKHLNIIDSFIFARQVKDDRLAFMLLSLLFGKVVRVA